MDEITSKLFNLPDQEIEALWTQIQPEMDDTQKCIKTIADYFSIKDITFQPQDTSLPNKYDSPSDTSASASNNANQNDSGDQTQPINEILDLLNSYTDYFNKIKILQTKQELLLQDIPKNTQTPKS